MNCKHMEEVEVKLASLESDVDDITSDISDLENRMYRVENSSTNE